MNAEKTLLFDDRSIGCAFARVNGTIAEKSRETQQGKSRRQVSRFFVIAFSLSELYGSRSRQEGSLKKCPHMKDGYLKFNICKLFVD
jgi:hypothetical protein